jgi:hypothetical protein
MDNGHLAHNSLIALSPTAITSAEFRSVTKLFAIVSTTPSIASGGTRSWAATKNNCRDYLFKFIVFS